MEFLASKPTLPSFQGGILLYLMYRLYGMDKIAASFGQEIFRCIKTLGLDSYSIPGETYSYKRSRGISVWWWFWMQSYVLLSDIRMQLLIFSSVVSYHYKELPPQNEIPAAPFPNPDLEPEFYGELHLRYPLGQILQPMHFGWSLHKTIMHGVLMHKYSTKRFAYDGTANAADVQEFADGLRGWYQTLPDVLLPERLVLPTHFKAQYVNFCSLSLCDMLITTLAFIGCKQQWKSRICSSTSASQQWTCSHLVHEHLRQQRRICSLPSRHCPASNTSVTAPKCATVSASKISTSSPSALSRSLVRHVCQAHKSRRQTLMMLDPLSSGLRKACMTRARTGISAKRS